MRTPRRSLSGLFTAFLVAAAPAQRSPDELPPASLSLDGDRIVLQVDDTGASYPLYIDPFITTEEAKLTASDAGEGDWFGVVALSGDTAVVGAPTDDHAGGTDAGSAFVFVRSGTSWTEQAKLTASDAALNDRFGYSVAISGDTIMVGSPYDEEGGNSNEGAAYVFVRSGTSWIEQAKLTASELTVEFGNSVALSGDTALIGGRNSPAYVFVRSGTTWSEQALLIASDWSSTDLFGFSVAVSDDTALVGSWRDDHAAGTDAGSAYVFARSGTTWSEQAKLTASDAAAFDYFGESVSLSGGTALVGAKAHDISGGIQSNQGAVYVFVRSGTTWTEEAKLVASDAATGGHFGASVALSGDTALVGAHAYSLSLGSGFGAAYLFGRSNTNWIEQGKLTPSDPELDSFFGGSVALSNDTAMVAAPLDDLTNFNSDEGSAYVFRLPLTAVVYCTAGTSASGCQALLASAGTASASAGSGFDLMATGVEGAKDGLYFFGTNGQQANPWGNGTSYQCVAPPVKRAGLLQGVGTVGLCDGSFSQDLNALWCPTCPKPASNPGAGALVQAQLWYRDPQSTSNQPTSLSDAIEFGVAP